MTTHDPALLWAAERAGLPYDRFVKGLTPETITRIRAAYRNRYVYEEAPSAEGTEDIDACATPDNNDATAKEAATCRIRAAFEAKKSTLPREIRPEMYEAFLDEINVMSKAERHILGEVVKEEIRGANLAVTRVKLKHFLRWLDGKP